MNSNSFQEIRAFCLWTLLSHVSPQLSNSVNIDFAYSHIHLLWFFHLCLHFFELLSTSCQSRHKIYKMGEIAIIWWFLLKIYTHGFLSFFPHFKMNRVTKLRRVEDMGEGGVKKTGKSGDVLYGRPLTTVSSKKGSIHINMQFSVLHKVHFFPEFSIHNS